MPRLDPEAKELDPGATKRLKAEEYNCVHIPGAKSGHVFACAVNGDGILTPTPVNSERKPAFRRSRSPKHFIPEREQEQPAMRSVRIQAGLEGK
jgi:hypothetical protein